MTKPTRDETDPGRLTAAQVDYYWYGVERPDKLNQTMARQLVAAGCAYVIDAGTIGAIDASGHKAGEYQGT